MNTFVEECESAGIRVEPYQGRFWWKGPAARASSIDDVIKVARSTTVPLQWDAPFVYPTHADEAWYEAHKDDCNHESVTYDNREGWYVCDLCDETNVDYPEDD